MMPGPRGVSRLAIIRLLQEGHSNREIARRLGGKRERIARIRAELGMPRYQQGSRLTLEQAWVRHARPVAGGHMRWTGGVRGCTPNLVHGKRNHSARRIAFRLGHGREPVGRVLPGCGHTWCVAPEHATDTVVRRADHAFDAIFGRAA
jgi:hypothetical protein